MRTSPVRFLHGPLGLVDADDPRRFVCGQTVNVGDVGELVVQIEEGDNVPEVVEGWVLVRVGDLYAPVHPDMVEVVR